MSINLKVPDLQELKPRITVIGVGGAGGNAVNNMIDTGLTGVEFIVANTDAQALTMSAAESRVQIGVQTTEGLGAGSKPDIGREAAEEAAEEIRTLLSGSHMVFVAAGMGGGTGTGAAPVIAKIAQDEGILTVGVVTKPFHFEGGRRMRVADEGVEELRKYVDTLIVIPNQNLFRIANERTTFAEAFKLADRVLHAGIACVTDLIVKDGLINLDFADVKAIMNGMGSAVMGTGQSSGDHRALEAAEQAIKNPLLDDISLQGAKGLLVSITGGDDLTLYDVDEATTRIRQEVDPDALVILGAAFDETLNGQIRVSIVASGVSEQYAQPARPAEPPLKHSLQQRLENADLEQNPAPQAPNNAAGAPPAPPPAGQPVQQKGAGNVRIEMRPPVLTPSANAQPQANAPRQAPPARPEMTRQQPAFVPHAPAEAPRRPMRMPELNEFPPHTQEELQASQPAGSGQQAQPRQAKPRQGDIQDQKKRVGFFERLTNVTRQNFPGDSLKNLGFESQKTPPKAPADVRNQQAQTGPAETVNNSGRASPSPQGGVSVRNAGPHERDNEFGDGPEDIDIPPFLRRKSR